MPSLAGPTDRFGAWGGGPLTGTVTTPPPSAGPAAPPSATAGGYIPQPQAALPESTGGESDGDFAGGITPWSTRGGWGGGPGDGGNGTGAGIDGGGDSGGTHGGIMGAGTQYFDGGGEVDDDTGEGGGYGDQAQQGGAPDAMSVIKQALSFGRQQMGMPADFSAGFPMSNNIEDRRGPIDDNGQTIPGGAQPTLKAPSAFEGAQRKIRGFEDGGEVPMPGDDQQQQQGQQGTGGSLPDPRKMMAYLAGAGGVQPDIADALERHVDPQGQMDPAERVIKAITTAPTPESQFGLMQHYRTRANAYGGAALAALDQGNLAQAAQHATAVFNNTPTGYKVQFVPAQGGLAMSAKKIGGQQPQPQQGQQQGFSDGGAVDADNPTVVMKGYDDGGEVDDEDTDNQGVLPTSGNDGDADDDIQTGTVQGQQPQQQEWPGVGINAPGAQQEAPSQPVVLQLEQVKKIVAPGAVDTANDHPKGFMGWLSDVLGGLGKAAAPGPRPAARGEISTQAGQSLQDSGGVGGLLRAGVTQGAKAVMSAFQPDVQAALTDDKQQQPQGAQQPQDQQPPTPGPAQSFPRNQSPGVPMQPQRQPTQQEQQGGGQQQGQDDVGKMIRNAKQMADAAFPEGGVAMSPEKRAYYASLLKDAQGNAAKLDQTNAAWGGRSNIAGANRDATNTRAANAEDGKNTRSANSLAEKLAAVQITVGGKAATAGQANLVKLIGQQISANPTGVSNPDTILKQIAPYAQQLKQQGVTPQDIMQNLQRAQQGGASGQTGQQPQVGERKQFKQGWGVWDGTAWKPE